MRVISGKYKNRELKSIQSQGVRPTTSTVKKSLFQILEPFDDKKILDLFAGIGSLGIESLSRGASESTFVEKNKRIITPLSYNVKKICSDSNYKIIHMDVEKYLKICSDKYDIIFADPPYGYIAFEELKTKVLKLLNYKGIFCMERRYEKDECKNVRIKNYGKTQILIWENEEK